MRKKLGDFTLEEIRIVCDDSKDTEGCIIGGDNCYACDLCGSPLCWTLNEEIEIPECLKKQ